MKRSQATGRLRLVLAVALGVLLASALLRSLGGSGSVMLLHVGYSEEGNRVCPVVCLTNGSSKPIAFSSYRGVPISRSEERTASGWVDPYARCVTSGAGLQTCVLQPGQSVTFRRPARSVAWRAGVKYQPCEVRRSPNTTSRNTFLGFVGSAGFREGDAQPLPGAVVLSERTFMRRVQSKLPKLTPAWLKRYVNSKASDPVAWGPEMKSGTALNELAQRKAN